jgi:diguanylate cyclase (GGDEF)-like protein
VLRFAIGLSLSLAVASALVLVVVHHFAISQAERSATQHARLVASSVLRREVEPGDLARRVSAVRKRQLDAAFGGLISDEVLGVSLVGRDGRVTYSTNARATGTLVSPRDAAEGADGLLVSVTSRASSTPGERPQKIIATYTPVRPGLADGAAVIVQPYGPIAGAARTAQLRVGVVLEAVLLALFLLFVPLLARVTRRIGAQMDRIHFQAFYDQLTGLPNRVQLFERVGAALERAKADGRVLAVMVVDIDRFRELNSTLGRETGDALLVEAASRLRSAAGDHSLLARLDGGEFAVVTEHGDEQGVQELAEALRTTLEPPILLGGLPFALDCSIGLAFHPQDGSDAETLLKHAEAATYRAKEWHVGVLAYGPDVDPHHPEQLELMGELRAAADGGELSLLYQPKLDLGTSQVVGFEALTYWQHPSRGLLPPGAFIPTAERTGAIRHVTRAVLAGAVRQLGEWSSLHPGVGISVNLTAVDLLDADLPARLKALLQEHAVDPGRLCIELTERTVMAVPDRAEEALERIVAAGAQVSIDDFGTGHSSLAYLKNLPAQELKIDRSFVADMAVSSHDRMIVLAAIQLGHNLGLRIVAEGVETTAVHEALRRHGCDQAQGYLYARPQPADVASASLVGRRLHAA